MPAECPKLVTLLRLDYLNLKTLHLGITPNLETLSLWDCTDMVELRMPAECPKLVNLDLSNLKLRTLHLGITPNLETLRLNNCRDLVEVHFQFTPKLKELCIYKCDRLEKLQMPIECPNLEDLYLSNLKLTTLHLGITPILKTINL